ncbi:MAG: ArsR/SmtB family transcription factor [Candidatus Binataceae bacterium]
MNTSDNPFSVAQALAEPLRLALLRHLMGGPATVSELVSTLDEPQSKVSNHLALLRERGLVHATRQGRQIVYQLRDRTVAELIESLMAASSPSPEITRKSPPLINARTCYDHLAGRLGVAVFEGLIANGAIVALAIPDAADQRSRQSWLKLELGPAAETVFGKLAIDTVAVARERRKFATACLDWTERRPHLGGALGAELYVACLSRGWVVKRPGTRVLTVTGSGRGAFKKHFGVRLETPNRKGHRTITSARQN